MIRQRRAGSGCSSGSEPTEILSVRDPDGGEPPGHPGRFRIGDIPCLAAAIDRSREDISAYEQTERYWRGVWS